MPPLPPGWSRSLAGTRPLAVAADHDLVTLAANVLDGRSRAVEELLHRVLAQVPLAGRPAAPRLVETAASGIPGATLDAILARERAPAPAAVLDRRRLSKAHARLIVAAVVAGRGDDRRLLRNAIAVLGLVHRLRVLELVGPRLLPANDLAEGDLGEAMRRLEYAGRGVELTGFPSPLGAQALGEDALIDDPALVWDLPVFEGIEDVIREARNAEITAGPHDKRIEFDPPRVCDGGKVTIRHTGGLWAGRTVTAVRFSSRASVASLPADFSVVDDEIVVDRVPVGSVSGPVGIDLAPDRSTASSAAFASTSSPAGRAMRGSSGA